MIVKTYVILFNQEYMMYLKMRAFGKATEQKYSLAHINSAKSEVLNTKVLERKIDIP